MLALGAVPPSPPEIVGLFYAGRSHMLSGEHEGAKSWMMLAASAAELQAGRAVIYVDSDDMGPSDTLERLRALGVQDEQIGERFSYLRPEQPLDEQTRSELIAWLRGRDGRLICFDTLNPLLGLHRLAQNAGDDIDRFYEIAVVPFKRAGIAVVSGDHVAKNKEARGRYAIGSQAKIARCDVHLKLTGLSEHPFGRGLTGKSKIVVDKDRGAFLTRPNLGLFVVVSDPESGACSWRIEPDRSTGGEGEFRPTHLMERVSKFLELAGAPLTRNQIRAGVQGNTDWKWVAIDCLVREDYLTEYPGERGAKMVQLVKPYREADDGPDEEPDE